MLYAKPLEDNTYELSNNIEDPPWVKVKPNDYHAVLASLVLGRYPRPLFKTIGYLLEEGHSLTMKVFQGKRLVHSLTAWEPSK